MLGWDLLLCCSCVGFMWAVHVISVCVVFWCAFGCVGLFVDCFGLLCSLRLWYDGVCVVGVWAFWFGVRLLLFCLLSCSLLWAYLSFVGCLLATAVRFGFIVVGY